MADTFKVEVKFSYHTIAQIEDHDLGVEVLNLIKAKHGTKLPATPDQVLAEQLQNQLDKAETQNYTMRQELTKLTKALEAMKPPVAEPAS